jgi:ABC-2 type transport system ATP-binding protein
MIEVKELKKSFGSIHAVDRVSFSVAKGEVLGFLGPNGAGKTTTMKMLACFLAPDSGTARITGHDIITDSVKVREALGYLAENAPSYDEMTVNGFLRFICETRGMARREVKGAIERVAGDTAIAGVMHQPIGTLSKGFRRRVGLAQALVHDPPVLILDEPTDGLDPNQKHDVRELIKKLAPEKCIIISTHILEEVEAICTRMVIINKGRVLVDSTPKAVHEKFGGTLDEYFRKITVGEAAHAGGGK